MQNATKAILAAILLALAAVIGLFFVMRQLSKPVNVPPPAPPVAIIETRTPFMPATETPQSSNLSPTETPPTLSPASTDVIRIGSISITQKELEETHTIDVLMNELMGQAEPTRSQTMDLLINETLLLQATGLEHEEVDPDRVETQIATVASSLKLDEDELQAALAEQGLTREMLSMRVARLLLVEQAVETMSLPHPDLEVWLAEARQKIEMVEPVITDEPAVVTLEDIAASTSPDPDPPPPISPVLPTHTPTPPGQESTPDWGQQAPDFTLESAFDGAVTLSDYRDQSRVILVFYRGST